MSFSEHCLHCTLRTNLVAKWRVTVHLPSDLLERKYGKFSYLRKMSRNSIQIYTPICMYTYIYTYIYIYVYIYVYIYI